MRDERSKTKRQWLPATVLVCGVLATALAGWVVNAYLTRTESAEAGVAGDRAAAAVRLVLDRAAIAVRSVRAMYAAGGVTADAFQRFAQTLLSSQSVSALGFVRRVDEADRPRYEASLTTPPGSMVGIWELGPEGQPVPAAVRPLHLVLEATVVPGGLPPSYGFDVMSLPDRSGDMVRALDRFQLSMSNRISLTALSEVGFTLFDPVVDEASHPIGVAAGSLTERTIIDAAAQASGVSNIALAVGDPGTASLPAPAAAPAEAISRSFPFADRQITVSVGGAPALPIRPWIDLLVVALGLAATAAIVAAIFNRAKTVDLRIAQQRLRGMLDGLGPIALLLSPDGRVVQANQAAAMTFRRAEGDMLRHPIEDMFAGADEDDRERLRVAIAAANRGEDARFDLQLATPDGRQVFDVWIRRKAVTGNLVASAVDVTDRYEAEETQRLLMRELDHRMKNTLQVIQAIIRRTAGTQGSIAAFEKALLGRVGAMSRAHDLLASERWHGADITLVVRQETEHFGSARAVRIEGPHIRLNPKAALSLALVVHELGTNALKYGALSTPKGQVDISWDVDRTGDEPRLVLRWQESHGPEVKKPGRHGFGSLLIERSIAFELDGSAELDYRKDGLVCTISAPLKAVRPFLSHVPLPGILAAE